MPDRYELQQMLQQADRKPDPEETGISELAKHADPSNPTKADQTTSADKAQRQRIEWVRLEDLVQRGGMRLGEKTALGQESGIRAARSGVKNAATNSGRRIAEASRRLPPLSAFGQRSPDTSASRTPPGLN
jgi:hypothetical protein